MDYVGMLVRLEHEFQRRPTEESESFGIIVMTVEDATIEEIVLRMWLDEKAFQALHKPEVNVAPNPLVVVRNPKIAVAFGQAPNAVVTHAIVLGQDDFNRVATNPQFAGEALNDIAQSANLCGGSAFGCDHHDIHGAREALKVKRVK
jgi:hypothetical protein